jgi:uncharacterized protein YndB with AHSA1/START domain
MEFKNAPVAKAEMLIRRPVSEVFEAFVDPAITSKFWFSKGSGKLEEGKQVQWDWEMYNFSVQVNVKKIEANKRILVEWLAYGAPTQIEWVFTPLTEDTTFVSCMNSGFVGDGDEIVKQAVGSTEGFAFVLAGAKALLEHNVKLNLVPDRFPRGLAES